jgi:radical SAM superfamily enzyme YgiQ (UPF0313 family)
MPDYKILFINAIDTTKGLGNYPSLGIGYLVSSLREKFGHDVIGFKVLEDNIEKEIEMFKPDIVAISSVSANYNRAIEDARIAKAHGVPVLVGGVHISMLPQTLTEDMNIGVLGEGEETICDLFELYKKGDMLDEIRLEGVQGIVYRDKQGNLHVTSRRSLIHPLDRIPLPSRDLLDIKPDTYMFTGRGCPYKCIFCSSTRFWGKVRLNSAEYVVNEIEHLVDEYHVKSIYFCDDIFILSVRRIELILELLEERNLLGKASFICACRSNLINERTVSLLKRLGVTQITMGFESGCNKTLQYLKGNTVTVETHEKAIRIIRNYDIEIMGGFIVGSPQESREDMDETIDFIRRNKLINVGIYPLAPLPGTPLWDYAKEKKLVDDAMNWDLLAFTEFQYNHTASIHLSEKLNRKDLYKLIQRFRWWRRGYVVKYLIKKSLVHPLKIREVAMFLIKEIGVKIRLTVSRIRMSNGVRKR